jgi:uncharacterized UPF0160 family protein
MFKTLEEVPDHGITHGGTFHADDVFSTALLRKIHPDFQVTRGFVPENYDGIVYDIGLGEYDHHQKDNEVREDGTPYASFGKLWRDLAPLMGYSDYILKKFDEDFVKSLDASDNGVGEINIVAKIIASYNPVWDSKEDINVAFAEAVDMAGRFMDKELGYLLSVERAEKIVLDAYEQSENKHILVLPQYTPWTDLVQRTMPEVDYVIFPSNRGGYNIQTVPTVENPMVGRKPFPERWLGNPDESLGMTFCHVGNFLASTETLEQAINVATIAIDDYNQRMVQNLQECVNEHPEIKDSLNAMVKNGEQMQEKTKTQEQTPGTH